MEKSIPVAVLKGARGLAILTVAKVGAVLTYKLGTGLVVSRGQTGHGLHLQRYSLLV